MRKGAGVGPEQRTAAIDQKAASGKDKQMKTDGERKQRVQRPEMLLESIANDVERALGKAARLDDGFREIIPDIKALGRKTEELADKARKKRERFA